MTDEGGCGKDTASAKLVVYSAVTADITPLISICVGTGTIPLTVTNLSGVGPFTYQWSKSNDGTVWSPIIEATSSTFNAPISSINHTYYKVVITDKGVGVGCNKLSLVTEVNAFAADTVRILDTICAGESETGD